MSDTAGTSAKTVLMFDDDPDFILQQKLQLQAAGYLVVDSDSAENVPGLVEDVDPDIVVVDLMMEEEDTGFTICYTCKKIRPDMPVIMVTGVASETGLEFDAATDEERSWVKADALLAKPIRFEQLQAEIQRLLGA